MSFISYLWYKCPSLLAPNESIPSNVVKINLSDTSNEINTTIKKETDNDSNVVCIDISDDDSADCEPNYSSAHNKYAADSESAEEKNELWEQWLGIGFDGTKQVFYCKYSDECHFKTNLRMKIKSHINKHFDVKLIPKLEEHEFWEECLPGLYGQTMNISQFEEPTADSTPKSRTASKHSSKSSSKSKTSSKKQSQTKGKPSKEATPHTPHTNSFILDNRRDNRSTPTNVDTSGLIDINFNQNNTILSLKGMASVKKLEKYIQCRVINGMKYFCCNFKETVKECEFKSKRSQETANHVHCAHLGFYLECVRPDCDKVFRTPGSWREHQKNHICNFGLYGYQKGVTGVCRNSHLLKFQDKVIVEGNHKAYKCKFRNCGFVTRQRTACKRVLYFICLFVSFYAFRV